MLLKIVNLLDICISNLQSLETIGFTPLTVSPGNFSYFYYSSYLNLPILYTFMYTFIYFMEYRYFIASINISIYFLLVFSK